MGKQENYIRGHFFIPTLSNGAEDGGSGSPVSLEFETICKSKFGKGDWATQCKCGSCKEIIAQRGSRALVAPTALAVRRFYRT